MNYDTFHCKENFPVFITNPHSRCTFVHVPSISEIRAFALRTGSLPPNVEYHQPSQRQGEENFDTDISSRDPRQADLNQLYSNMTRVSKQFVEDVSKEASKLQNSPEGQ